MIVTNEGNADLGTSLPPLHIACLGIEKLVPDLDDVVVFLRLLARSATGQALSVYTSFLAAPRAGGELHVVLVDNGRSALLASATHRSALALHPLRRLSQHLSRLSTRGWSCLWRSSGRTDRRGACARRWSRRAKPGNSLTRRRCAGAARRCARCASTCTSSCSRGAARRPRCPASLRRGARLAAALLSRPRLFRAAGHVARLLWPLFARRFPGNPASPWLSARAWPEHPGASFAERWRKTRGAGP